MPVEHFVDQKLNILRVRRWEHIDTQDEDLAFSARGNDPLIVPGIPVLVNCTEVEPTDSTELIEYIAKCTTRIAADLQCGPLAIVVSSDIEYGMARMYMAYTELSHPNTNVFRSESEALEWLVGQR